MENSIYRIGHIGVFSIDAKDPETAKGKLKKWIKECPCGAVNIERVISEHHVFEIIDTGRINEQNKLCCEMTDVSEVNCACRVLMVKRRQIKQYAKDGAIMAETEAVKYCLAEGKSNYTMYVSPTDFSASEDEDRIKLSSYYWDVLNAAKSHEIHSIAFSINKEMFFCLKTASETIISTISAWLSDNPEYGMTVNLCCPEKMTYEAIQNYISIID